MKARCNGYVKEGICYIKADTDRPKRGQCVIYWAIGNAKEEVLDEEAC
jgi:hypothetical protein